MKRFALIFFLITSPYLSSAQDLQFGIPFTFSDGTNSIDVTVGVDPNGDTAFVDGLDKLAPPAPPDGAFDARVKVGGISYFAKYLDNALTEKPFAFEYTAATGNGPITVTWDDVLAETVADITVEDNFGGLIYSANLSTLGGSFTPSTASPVLAGGFVMKLTPTGNEPPKPSYLTFALPINVSDGENNIDLTVAVSNNGSSTSFIEGFDQLAPPAPPDGAFDARMKVNGTSYFTKYLDNDKFLGNELTEKTVRFEYSAADGNGPITLTWNQEALNILGTFTIKDEFDIPGFGVNVSLNELDGSYTIPISSTPPFAFIQSNFNLVFTPSGVSQISQSIDAESDHYRLLSAPVENTTLETLLSNNNIFTQCFAGSNRPDCSGNSSASANVFFYNTSNDSWEAASNITQSVPSGTGVLVYKYINDDQVPAGPGFPSEITLFGSAPTDDVIPSINTNPDGFTLVGNPFGHTIDSDDFDYTDVEQVVYVYDHKYEGPFEDDDSGAENTTGGWRTWNGGAGSLTDGLIPTYQGFFVQTGTVESSPSLTIPLSSQRPNNTASLFTLEETEPAFRIASRVNQSSVSEFWVSFEEDGSLDRNRKDAIALYPLEYADFMMIYTKVDETSFSTKNLPTSLEAGAELPIHIDAWQASGENQTFTPATGTVELRWDQMETLPSTMQIYLHDHQTGSVIDMRSQSNYSYVITEDEKSKESLIYSKKIEAYATKDLSDSRFSLVFNELPTSNLPDNELPSVVKLHQNYPNPFNPTTQFAFDLPSAQTVTLSVFDITGRKIADVTNGFYQAGTHQIRFDASSLSSGVYFYHLKTDQTVITKSMMLMK